MSVVPLDAMFTLSGAMLFLRGTCVVVTHLRRLGELHLVDIHNIFRLCFFCVEVLRPIQPNGVMSNGVSLPNRTFTGQA